MIEWDKRAIKELKKLDKQIQRQIIKYLNQQVLATDDPKQVGKALTGNKKGLWRYRVGDYRLICHFEGDSCVILVLRVGHRKTIYR